MTRKFSKTHIDNLKKSHLGKTPWNKGLRGVQIGWNKGKKFPQTSGENNHNWKGDKVGYRVLHKWVERRLGKPQCCDKCGDIKKHRYHWANKSGKYLRIITDWKRLCPKCHGKYDKERR